MPVGRCPVVPVGSCNAPVPELPMVPDAKALPVMVTPAAAVSVPLTVVLPVSVLADKLDTLKVTPAGTLTVEDVHVNACVDDALKAPCPAATR